MQVSKPSPSPILQSSSPSSLNHRQPRNGPQANTHHHYTSSRSSSRSTRKPTKTPSTGHPSPIPSRVQPQYKDAATQYSPTGPMGYGGARPQPSSSSSQITDASRPSTTDQLSKFSNPTTQQPAAPLAAQPISQALSNSSSPARPPESPKVKRRPSGETSQRPGASNRQLIPLKRRKAGDQPVKILPTRYELCDVEDIVILIANMISELIETNDPLPLRDGVLTRFHSRIPPGISVLDYLQRLAKHATLTPPLLLSMVYYIDRLCSLYPAFTITTLTIHRFLITAATVAAKGLSDSFWNNSLYARVGGIRVAELGLLELELLYRVDWKIVPNPEVLVDYYRGLVERSDTYRLDESVSGDGDQTDGVGSTSDSDDGGSSGHIETNARWNEWMKSVADESMVSKDE